MTILFHLLSHKQQVEVIEVFVSSVNQGYRPLLLLNVMPTDKKLPKLITYLIKTTSNLVIFNVYVDVMCDYIHSITFSQSLEDEIHHMITKVKKCLVGSILLGHIDLELVLS